VVFYARSRLCVLAAGGGLLRLVSFVFFFFQAEDGIRDWSVTGVQTCALPISSAASAAPFTASSERAAAPGRGPAMASTAPAPEQIGRASCRERVEMSAVAVSLKKKQVKGDRAGECEG